ncbi:AAA family ATPase, partial [Arthrobacter wenxiniae]|nr:AAA family ATPase [Arthrobacter wenxiniae]
MTNRPHAANSRPFVFSDAVELLNGKSNSAINISDRVATAAILTAGVAGAPGAFSLLAPKNALVEFGKQLQERIPNEISGSHGIGRTQRIVAAHSILVITSFFDAAALIQTQVPGAKFKLTGKEELQVAVRDKAGAKLGNLVEYLLNTEIPYPKPELAFGEIDNQLVIFYEQVAASLSLYCKGLRFWDDLDDRERRSVEYYIEQAAPKTALVLYKEGLRKLANEVHEFEIWLNEFTTRGIQVSFQTQGEATLGKLDAVIAAQHEASQQFEEFRRYLQRVAPETKDTTEGAYDLIRMIESVNQIALTPPDVARMRGDSGASIPRLSELYIEPPFKVVTGRSQINVSREDWWTTIDPRHDIDDFFGAYLTTSPTAFTSPLLVLGHPGSGKSSLTRVLADRLSNTSFVAIRVELRRVTPSQAIEVQIEEGLHSLLGRATTWKDFRQATHLTPVVFLDGLDELIQASDEKQTDYLEQVQLFQQRELSSGGVYVIVTSRTVVADQTRIPPDSIVLKIDDFGDSEISSFVDKWNTLNREYFDKSGVRPLPAKLPVEVAQLAGQPLLLLLLALLDSDSNALQSDLSTRTKASTYRQILVTFIRRELLKHQPKMDDDEVANEIQSELLRLSYIALGMFNRGVQMVSARQVSVDLAALSNQSDVGNAGDSVQKVLGRFFFVHQAQSKSPDGLQTAYEFLHSTFGEYLVAHLAYEVVKEVQHEAERMAHARFSVASNVDQWASTLFAFQALSQRTQILEFFAELAAESAVQMDISLLLVGLAISRLNAGGDDMAMQVPYHPIEATISSRLSTYTCNLILLACCMTRKNEGDSDGMRNFVSIRQQWDTLVYFWQSQMEPSAWAQLNQVLWARSCAPLPPELQVDHALEIGLEFLTPASGSNNHLTHVSQCRIVSPDSLRIILADTLAEDEARRLVTGDIVFGAKSVVGENLRVHFVVFQDIHFVFDTEDLLAELQNPRRKTVPTE